jgi:plasmid replication initiation protein
VRQQRDMGFLLARIPQTQLDLFIATASDLAPKSHQDLMARNWFSLSKRRRTEPIIHSYQDNWVKITGNARHGIATIFDNDVLIFVIAQYMNAINHGMKTGRRFQFTGYEYHTFTGKKHHGGKAYLDLWRSLQRLHNTFVETNIRLGSTNTTHSFNWLSEIKQVKDGNTHRGYEIVLPEWVYESITNKKMVLTLDDDYFTIRGGLARWLYLFARKTSGFQSSGWSESIESIYNKSASTGTLSEFRRKVKNIATKNDLLGYSVELVTSGGIKYEYKRKKDIEGLYFLRKNQLIEMIAADKPKSSRRGAIQWRKE